MSVQTHSRLEYRRSLPCPLYAEQLECRVMRGAL